LFQIVYERYAFDPRFFDLSGDRVDGTYAACCTFVYLGRDVMVRVFYALGDSDTPFKISIVNIGLADTLFDYLFIAICVAGFSISDGECECVVVNCPDVFSTSIG
jgi:putative peptidoglycan lipid II flippase